MLPEAILNTPTLSGLLSWGRIARLGLVAVLEGALICSVTLGPWPGAGIANLLRPEALPMALLVITLAFGLLLAPGWSAGVLTLREAMGRSFYWGAWNGAALGFFLLVASRVEPLENGAVLRCQLVVFGTLMLAALLAVRLPRHYAGLTFFWCAGLPLICYMVAEVFLGTPRGSGSWSLVQGGPGQQLHTLVSWALTSSPGTASAGALNAGLADGTAFGWKETGLFLCLLLAMLVVLLGTWPAEAKARGIITGITTDAHR